MALSRTNTTAWATFVGHYAKDRAWLFDGGPVPEGLLEAWQGWMTTVFMPANRSMVELALSKADLLEDDEMPSVLMALSAHVAGYEVLLKRWEKNDYSQLTSLLNYPDDLPKYAAARFTELKQKQRTLLRQTAARRLPGAHH